MQLRFDALNGETEAVMDDTTQETRRVDILQLIFEAISNNKRLWGIIDHLYNERFEEIVMCQKATSQQIESHSKGSLRHDIICNKLSGIYALPDRDDITLSLIIKGWNNIYTFLKKFNNVKTISWTQLSNYINSISEEKNNDIFFDNLIIVFPLLHYFDIEIICDESEQKKYNSALYIIADLTKSSVNMEELLQKTRPQSISLRKKYFRTKSRIYGEDVSLFTTNCLSENMSYLLSSIDSIGMCHLESAFDDIYLSKKDIEDILSLWIVYGDYQNDDKTKLYLSIAMRLRLLQKSFNQNKQFFISNFDDSLKESKKDKALLKKTEEELASCKAQLNIAKSENINLKTQYKKTLELDNVRLQKKLLDLQCKISDYEDTISDYESLLDQTTIVEETITKDNGNINEIDISLNKFAIVGGIPSVIDELSKTLSFYYIAGDDKNADITALKNVKVIFFKTNYLCHVLFYKVSKYAKKNDISIRYIKSDNKGKMIEEIMHGLNH